MAMPDPIPEAEPTAAPADATTQGGNGVLQPSNPVPPTSGTTPAPATTATPPQKRGRVLMVDDEPDVVRGMARILTREGYEVQTVNNGQAAVEVIRAQEFDAIFSDIHMPGITGMELLRIVRERDLDVPVVLITGDPQIETATQAVELGALQYLSKPVPMETLCRTVDRAVKLSQLARTKREALKLLGALGMHASDKVGILTSFERALSTLWVAFQPIVSLSSRHVYAYEALMRTREPTLPDPGSVLDAADRLGRREELGRRIRALAAQAFTNGPKDSLLFVNLHALDLLDPILASTESPLTCMAHRVVFEITERAAVDEIKDIRARIAGLRALGFRIAVDDLGAGYAGLTSFALLEPEFVKLDMSIVRGANSSPIKQKLIGSITTMCQDMGISVVAEGIETVEERDTLTRLGCNLLQGYLFARPGPPFPSPAWP